MRRTAFKRIAAFALAGAMSLALAGCGPSKTDGETGNLGNSTAGEGKLFTEPTEMNIVVSSAVSWPLNTSWKLWQYFQEATGATFHLQGIPDTDFQTKLSLMLSTPKDMPDMIYFDHKWMVDGYATSGPFVSLSGNLDKLPNMVKFLDSFPEGEREEMLRQRYSGDGQIYSAPIYGTHTIQNLRT